tara:strand:- start:140 stop:1036 length:897 start_codon:yes stop_codon:yes gene_type:complete
MLQSMTGYGKAEINLENANCIIEVKSLNSKQIDTTVKMSSIYRDKEIGLRKLLSEKLQRGKIEFSIWREKSASSLNFTINKEVIKKYHEQIDEIRKELGYFPSLLNENGIFRDIMQTMVHMPDVMQKGQEKANKNEWEEIQKGIDAAIAELLKFRLDEGKKLEDDIQLRIHNIDKRLNEILPFEKARIEKVKKKLSEKLAHIDTKNIDDSRLEQELIYYLEKQDITEEKVRLLAHLKYFVECLNSESPNGKKLAFIAQEIGREINTIGSKSSDAEMQKIVVQMTDELEKIKEQLLNIL